MMKPVFRYVYDRSFEGFLTCIYHFYKTGDCVSEICCDDIHTSFLVESKKIETDQELSNKVSDAIAKQVSYDALMQIYFAFLSELPGRELYLLDYIRLLFKHGSCIEHQLTRECVQKVRTMSRKTSRERHRMLGLVRFQVYKNILYAPIETECFVLPVLGGHFQKRMPNEIFMIHDVKRSMALTYDRRILALFPLKESELDRHRREDFFEQLWQSYHTHLSIEERKNPKLQSQHMPKKYWKYLTEMVPEGSEDR